MEHKLTQDEIEKIRDGRAVLVDVRSEKEVAEKSCKLAQHWDVDEMIQGRFPSISKDLPIFVFCQERNRSVTAQQLLIKEGFVEVHNIGSIRNVPAELCD